METDDDLPLYESWLLEHGFLAHGTYFGILVPCAKGFVVEITLTPDCGGWALSLLQESDHVTITSMLYSTRGQLRRFCESIEFKLKARGISKVT